MPKRIRPHTLVVGGTRGIGRAIVTAMCEVGHAVSVVGRSTILGTTPKAVRSWKADLAKTATLSSLCEQIVEAGGPPQNIVFAQRFRGTEDAWQGEFDVSLTAAKTIIEYARNRFMSGQLNSIVIVGSIAGQFVAEEQPASYHAVKGALRQLMRYYAVSLGPYGIRVNCVSPGVILKPEAEEFYRLNRRLVSLYERVTPLRRFGTAADVASVVRFLCLDDSRFITGQDIVVDGGISLAWQASLARSLVPVKVRKLRRSTKGT